MPQPTQHSLIHVLLLWTTILSILQAVFIILFFTTGHRGVSQNSSAVAPERTVQSPPNSTPSMPPSDHGLHLGKCQMLTYKATEVKGVITWGARQPCYRLATEGKELELKKDGYYFIYLQVTLKECTCVMCGQTSRLQPTVNLTYDGTDLLQGWINNDTCSTGLLGKAVILPAGAKLKVTISKTSVIDETESLTHLDIIYMEKPN